MEMRTIYLNQLEDLEKLVETMKEEGIEDVYAHFDEAIRADVIIRRNGLKYVDLTLEKDWE
jgi:uncharacterized membrane protein